MKGLITGKVVEWENGEKMEKLSEVGFFIKICSDEFWPGLNDLFEKPIQDFQFLGFHNIWSFTCGFNYNRNLFWLERSEE